MQSINKTVWLGSSYGFAEGLESRDVIDLEYVIVHGDKGYSHSGRFG